LSTFGPWAVCRPAGRPAGKQELPDRAVLDRILRAGCRTGGWPGLWGGASLLCGPGRHRRAELGALPDRAPGGDLLRPHHLRVVLRLVALVSDVVEHHIHGSAGPPPGCATSSTGWPGSPDSAPTPSRLCARPGRRPRCVAGRGMARAAVPPRGPGRRRATDSRGRVDTSFMTWPGLTVALEATIVADFPCQQEL